jgi:hypothetical protein
LGPVNGNAYKLLKLESLRDPSVHLKWLECESRGLVVLTLAL